MRPSFAFWRMGASCFPSYYYNIFHAIPADGFSPDARNTRKENLEQTVTSKRILYDVRRFDANENFASDGK
jgi:hypothetical protein